MEPVVHPGIRSPSLLARGKISVVIPVFKSERSLPRSRPAPHCRTEGNEARLEIILVDDCSPDLTWQRLKQLRGEHGSALRLAKLLKNSGQHNAILCGLSLVTGEVVVTMDDTCRTHRKKCPNSWRRSIAASTSQSVRMIQEALWASERRRPIHRLAAAADLRPAAGFPAHQLSGVSARRSGQRLPDGRCVPVHYLHGLLACLEASIDS